MSGAPTQSRTATSTSGTVAEKSWDLVPGHWGLRHSPFRGDAEFFYESPTHEEALARLGFLVDQRRRLGLLMGPSGSGKSLVLAQFARHLRRRGAPVAQLSLVGVEPGEMLALLAAEFSLVISPLAPLPVLWRAINDRLTEHRFQQVDTVILLDDADQASPALSGQISRLVAGESHDAGPIVVIAGQQERIGRVGRRLLDMAELRVDLIPWSQEETAAYLAKLLEHAGSDKAVFDEAAVGRLHSLSRGIPRRVSRLADLALLAGAGRGLVQIDPDTVESAYEELAV